MEAKQATLHHELIAQLLDSRIPKTEREHAAAREIERLRADLLQELIDAPEPEPVARVTGYYAGQLSSATVDGRVLPTGTALYLAPPAPSVPDGWKNAAEWLRNNYQDYPNISSLCEAMVAQSANNGSN